MRRSRGEGRSLLLLAGLGAILLHTGVGLGVGRLLEIRGFLLTKTTWPAAVPAGDDNDGAAGGGDSLALDDLAPIRLVDLDDPALGPPLTARPGAADESGFAEEHPAPRASFEAPGDRPARGGRDQRPGRTRLGNRADADDRRAQIWNDPRESLLPRSSTRRPPASPESIARAPERGFDDRSAKGPRARAGAAESSAGDGPDEARGAGGDAPVAPRFDDPDQAAGEPAPARPARRTGATTPGTTAALSPGGDAATETARRGPHEDDTSSPSASDERDPAPFELIRPSAGAHSGTGSPGSRDADHPGPRTVAAPGTAATRADLDRGASGAAARARLREAYVRRLVERLDRFVEYPRELALGLEQGEVVVAITLDKNGHLRSLELVKPSGFKEFDRAITRAVERAAPFGPVPRSLRGSGGTLRVTAPFRFSNPLIR